VYVQPVNEGRLHPNQHIFTSDRKLTERDFDSSLFDKTSKLRDNYKRGVARLNDDSNRLPQTAEKSSSAQPPGRWWIDQQVRNILGGVTSVPTKTFSAAASIPENAVKVGSSLRNTGETLSHIGTWGRTSKSAFNPIVTDKRSQYYNAPTNVERAFGGVQDNINKTLGVDSGSAAYKGAELIVPYLFLKRDSAGGGSASKVGSSGAGLQPSKTVLTSEPRYMPPPPSTMSKSTPSHPVGKPRVTDTDVAALRQRLQVTQNADGSPAVRLQSGATAPGIDALSKRYHLIKHDDGSITLKSRVRTTPEDVAALRQRLQVTQNRDSSTAVRLRSGESAPGIKEALDERFIVIKHDDGSMTLKLRK
jgi:hypothetical protein